MELRHLRCFLAVAEELHFARAAEKLHMEQSPLSRTIKELEEDLGEQLFVRTSRSTRLTRAGKLFLEHVPRVFSALQQARDSVKAAANGFHGQLRIALSDGITPSRLSSLLAMCRQEEPEVDIRLFQVPLAQQLKGLQDDLYDVGFAQSDEVGEGIAAEPAMKTRVLSVSLAAALAGSLMLAQPAAALTFVDPVNLVQNTLTAIRTLEQINNQINQLQNEAQMLMNQARNLASLDFNIVNRLRSTLANTERLIAEAQGLTVSLRSAESCFSNTSISRSSHAELRFFRSPSRLSILTVAIDSAVPPAFISLLCFSASLPLPAAATSFTAPFIASSPNITFRYSACCAVPSLFFLNELLMSLRIFSTGNILPLPSRVVIPSSRKASGALPTGACKRLNTALVLVPAILPLMPLSASTPSNAVVSSILAPAASAIGATYFIASPSSNKLVFELVKPFAITSDTRLIWSSGRLNADCMLVTISAASAISTPDASDRLTVGSVAARMASAS